MPSFGPQSSDAASGEEPSDGSAPSGPDTRLKALVLAPTGQDATLVGRVLDGTALDVVPLSEASSLCEVVADADAEVGVVLLTQEALALPGLDGVPDALSTAPDWSDVPFVLFVDGGWGAADYLGVMGLLGHSRNLTVLERPLRPVAFRLVVEMAVGGRRQQLRVRDLLARVRGFNGELRSRVAAQTATLRARADEVEALAKALAVAERRERERIAQVLHDDLQQVLYGLKIHAQLLAQGDAAAADRVERYTDEAITLTRHLVTDLHPPTLADDGVAAALGWVADTARERHGLTVHLDVIDGLDVPSPDLLALFTRAARELLFNVVKHADTDEAWVRAWCDAEGCHLEVRDEGAGFTERDDAGTTGLGLSEIEQRVELEGGAVEVVSVLGEGTAVELVLPAD